jgi:hypothetical protein
MLKTKSKERLRGLIVGLTKHNRKKVKSNGIQSQSLLMIELR